MSGAFHSRSSNSSHNRLFPVTGFPLNPEAEGQEILEAEPVASLRALTLLEGRNLVRDCLASWMAAACPEFEIIAFPDIGLADAHAAVARSAVVIVGVKDGTTIQPSLTNEIAFVRAIRENTPIGLIGAPDMVLAEALIKQVNVQGYIPNTATGQVAAAALRLIAAGGTYIPYLQGQSLSCTPPLNPALPTITVPAKGLLTVREQTVLQCLQRGMPNKLIAYELGISIGTAKLHVHNIIAKLKVHNRTEVVVVDRQRYFDKGHG